MRGGQGEAERHVLPGSLVIHGKMPPLPTGDLPPTRLGAAFFTGAFLATGLGAGFGAGFGAAFFTAFLAGAAFFGAAFAAFFGAARAIIERSATLNVWTFDSCSVGVAGAKAELRERGDGREGSVLGACSG